VGAGNGGMKWLVPVVYTLWSGKEKKKTIMIQANVNEWQAQKLASLKARWHKSFQTWYRRFDYSLLSIDHAIDFDTKKCLHGCCQLGGKNV